MDWEAAFDRGLAIWLWSLAWNVVGIVLFLIIAGGSLSLAISNPGLFASNPSLYLAGIFVGALMGGLATSVGVFSTIVKVSIDAHERTSHGQSLVTEHGATLLSETVQDDDQSLDYYFPDPEEEVES
jgi:hypothetical protein